MTDRTARIVAGPGAVGRENGRPDVVRVSMERSGGFTGLRSAATLDTDALPSAQAAGALDGLTALERLAATTPAAAGRPGTALPGYRLTVHWPSGDQLVQLTEPHIPPEVRPLLTELLKRARPPG
ncbi:protealysin inhibitor emfourin [Kitasatospora sp. MBT63]|uniref:protealysin inhibitor emfourin n=1 Tax=Kitasatospora sp. MBT63 TaxID=1444768 RepID=UPI0011EA6113|nr:protealysin inhibitor emfourin [Kitasatospora sp. MBT63]